MINTGRRIPNRGRLGTTRYDAERGLFYGAIQIWSVLKPEYQRGLRRSLHPRREHAILRYISVRRLRQGGRLHLQPPITTAKPPFTRARPRAHSLAAHRVALKRGSSNRGRTAPRRASLPVLVYFEDETVQFLAQSPIGLFLIAERLGIIWFSRETTACRRRFVIEESALNLLALLSKS